MKNIYTIRNDSINITCKGDIKTLELLFEGCEILKDKSNDYIEISEALYLYEIKNKEHKKD